LTLGGNLSTLETEMQTKARHAAITLALAAMMLRALLPMGWMPNPAGFAQSPLVICLMDMPHGGMSQMTMAMDMSMPDMGGHGHDQGQQQNNETCPFAAAPHLAAPALDAIVSEPEFAEATAVHLRAVATAQISHPYAPQSPRAPPSFA
jgi:hypothetical protein